MSAFVGSSVRAAELLDQLAELGVEHVIVCPGSRSQALALRAAEAERAGTLRVHVRTDERTAAFMALGIGLETGIPAAVITTSGSAVANLLPATLEAFHAGVPMLLLTADRPAELRYRRANQTTLQIDLLRAVVRESIDVPPAQLQDNQLVNPIDVRRLVDVATGHTAASDGTSGPGPVHVNLQFVEPLSGPAPAHWPSPGGRMAPRTLARPGTPARLEPVAQTLVVAGTGAGAAAEEFARTIAAPLCAEVTSGAHFGPNLIVAYRELLRLPEFHEAVRRVVVFGTPTLSREVLALCAHVDELVVVESPGHDRFAPAGRALSDIHYAAAVESPSQPETEWLGVWVAASRKLVADRADDIGVGDNGVAAGGHVEDFAAQRAYLAAELAAIRAPLTRERLVQAVWAATWPHDRLLFGASRLIRVADSVLPGKRITVFANRGQSGIDGTVATGMGVAQAASEGTTRVVLGDLAALHDVGSLKLTPGEPAPAIQVIVGNDCGGSIFRGLEVAESADADLFERVHITPHDVQFAALAEAYGWEYRRVSDVGALDQALTETTSRPMLIEVPLES